MQFQKGLIFDGDGQPDARPQKPIPFIVDDILVNFDDLRAESTLKVLAEFSNKTQPIFFTHRQRLPPLAERSIPDDILHIHSMNA